MPAGVKPRDGRKGGGHRRRHHGRRHRHELRQCRHPGDDRRDRAGRARQRAWRPIAEELRQHGLARRADAGGGATAASALITGSTDFDGAGRCRPRHRGGVRGDGRSRSTSSPSSTGSQSPARSSPPTPPRSTSTRSPRVDEAPAGRARHAFLQPGECHEAAGDRARREDRLRRARDRDRGRAQDRQGAGRRRRLLRLRRQPHAAPAHDARPSG